ncbi:MAG: FAD-dependent oxidoreductase, partial [Bilophila sp.]
ETAAGVIDQLRFLSTVRRTGTAPIGTRVLVIGAGNAAVDTARTVRRLHQQHRMEAGEVTIVYRRTRKEMPAALEEMQDALAEGVKLVELCAPDAVLQQDGKVVGLRGCCMQLEDDPHGGRPRPVKKEGMFQTLPADTLIVCIGQEVGTLASTVRCHKENRSDTTLSNVFVGGDAQRGASSLINAVGDGRKAAASILAFMGVAASTEHAAPPDDRTLAFQTLRQRQARRCMGAQLPQKDVATRLNFALCVDTLNEKDAREEAHRCLQCDLLCNICATVCPNRANLALRVPELPCPVQVAVKTAEGVRIDTVSPGHLTQPYQIINLADACNECGNCATFCPSNGAPYKDKPKVHLSRTAFETAPEGFFLVPADETNACRLEARHAGNLATLTALHDSFCYEDNTLIAHLDAHTFCAHSVVFKDSDTTEVSLAPAVEAILLYQILRTRRLFTGENPCATTAVLRG